MGQGQAPVPITG